METIVFASHNEHKIKEIKELITHYKILSLKDINFTEEIEETGHTFLENALIKAETIHKFLKEQNLDYMVMAEDSGLCVASLNGAPGIYSARYAGEEKDLKACREKLQRELVGKDKKATFESIIVLYYPNGEYKSFEGKAYGHIIEEERGIKEFGYDCIFYSEDLNKTFGEATSEEKNNVSHRGRALREMLKELE